MTIPARELRPIIERIYWSAVGSLADKPEELTDEATYQLKNAAVACPGILARLSDDDLLGLDEAQRGTNEGAKAV